MSNRVKLTFCWLVSLVWAANVVAGFIPPLNYKPDLVVNGPMLLVLGAVFQTRKKKGE